ncbi:SDR family NAD(P)-dependent oxidoreductase [Radicibacter daui]|uniref:SDR family NAD(P)-dependent oxidoreductase n=1 Tax=Radicibacter daui TaxID=3064829 RepID=UPI004046D31E
MTNHGYASNLFAREQVVVTGARRGIGAAVARAFLATGARVFAHSGITKAGNEDELLAGLDEESRSRLTLAEGDLASEEGCLQLAAAIKAAFDRVDVLVNNAGTMLGRKPAAEMDAGHYAQVVDLNARSAVLLTGELIPLLARSGHGAIVNTSSISARTGGSPGSSVYSAAKAFITTWTRALARELAPQGIRANVVSPGTIMTDFHRRYSTPEKLTATAAGIPLGRLGTAEDCAGAYLFLSSATLSGYITGQVIEVNGGQLMA